MIFLFDDEIKIKNGPVIFSNKLRNNKKILRNYKS